MWIVRTFASTWLVAPQYLDDASCSESMDEEYMVRSSFQEVLGAEDHRYSLC